MRRLVTISLLWLLFLVISFTITTSTRDERMDTRHYSDDPDLLESQTQSQSHIIDMTQRKGSHASISKSKSKSQSSSGDHKSKEWSHSKSMDSKSKSKGSDHSKSREWSHSKSGDSSDSDSSGSGDSSSRSASKKQKKRTSKKKKDKWPTEWPSPEPTEWPTPEPTDKTWKKKKTKKRSATGKTWKKNDDWPTPEPTDWPTPEPTEWPTPEPTVKTWKKKKKDKKDKKWPTEWPTQWPTPEPTDKTWKKKKKKKNKWPTSKPTDKPWKKQKKKKKTWPTAKPTAWPTPEPTEVPTPEPTDWPTPEPTEWPTPEPTDWPTPEPTEVPTPEPTDWPTPEPTDWPTPEPTDWPSPEPTEVPTPEPTEWPTPEPTNSPIQDICPMEVRDGYEFDFVILIDNSCGLKKDDCDNLLEGVGEIISTVLDDTSKTRVAVKEIITRGNANSLVDFDDDELQDDPVEFVQYVRRKGDCRDGGEGKTDTAKALHDAARAFDLNDDRIDKIIVVSACKDTRKMKYCNKRATYLDDRGIDVYAVNLIDASKADNVIGKKDADTYLECVTDDDSDRVCAGEDESGVSIEEFDDILECLLPKICEPPTPDPTEWPTPEPTDWPTPEPTDWPTPEPTTVPTPEPTEVPTPEPTEWPTPEPTAWPTPEPTEVPTPEPTEVPTPEPTGVPTPEPTGWPTPEPTELPTPEPTDKTWEKKKNKKKKKKKWPTPQPTDKTWKKKKKNKKKKNKKWPTPKPTEWPTPEPTEKTWKKKKHKRKRTSISAGPQPQANPDVDKSQAKQEVVKRQANPDGICGVTERNNEALDFVIFVDNSCKLKDDDCDVMREGTGEIIYRLLDHPHVRIATILFGNTRSEMDVLVKYDDLELQQDADKYVDYVRKHGECTEGGSGDTNLYYAIKRAQSLLDYSKISKFIFLSACRDMEKVCSIAKEINQCDIDSYIVNLIPAPSDVSNVIETAAHAKEYLSCLNPKKVCVGDEEKGISVAEFDEILDDCLLPDICKPNTNHATPLPSPEPTERPQTWK